MQRVIPFSRRKGDVAVLAFFWINILFITYVVDVEQIVLPDLSGDWEYPLWPPAPAIDLIHWYGSNFDQVLMARPAWWRMTIWIDSLFFGPFYVFAIYAWTTGKNWIRIPSIIYASVMITNVTIILGEELMGSHPTTHPGLVLVLNAPWLLFPIYIIARMYNDATPFTEDSTEYSGA